MPMNRKLVTNSPESRPVRAPVFSAFGKKMAKSKTPSRGAMKIELAEMAMVTMLPLRWGMMKVSSWIKAAKKRVSNLLIKLPLLSWPKKRGYFSDKRHDQLLFIWNHFF